MGKLVCEVEVGGQQVLSVITTAANANIGAMVKIRPGIGKPFWYWPSIPPGTVIGADFSMAPIVSSDIAANNTAIANIQAQPSDVLTYS